MGWRGRNGPEDDWLLQSERHGKLSKVSGRVREYQDLMWVFERLLQQ